MPSELTDAADVVAIAVVIIVKGMAAVTADVVRAVVALMHIIILNEKSHNRTLSILGMSATTALTTSAAAAAMPLTMMTTATTTTSAASANSEIISPTMSFNAFNLQSMQNANSLGHLSSRKDYYARTDLTFLVVFPLLFLAFNLCYWISLLFWRKDEEGIHLD